MKNEKADGLRQRWKRNRREIRGTIAVLVALLVATGTAVSLFLTAFAQTKTTYCGQKHEHTIACYSNPKADVETANKWEATLPKSDDDTPRVSKLVDVVRSQVGYQESKDNYAVEGDDLHGYTRYGAWDGDPYEPWNTTFVNFCLHYAGIDINVFSSKAVIETEESTQEDDAVAEEDDQEQNDVPEQGIELEQSDELEEYAAPQEDVPMAEDEQSEDTSWYADVQWDDDNQDAPDETEDEEASNAAWAEDMQWDDEPQDANASEETANDAEAANDDESADDAGSQAKPAKAPRSADEWKDRLTDAGLYVAPKEAKPHAGDMVFLCQPDDEDAKDATVGNKAKSGKDDDEDKSDGAVSEIQISADEVAGTDNDARSGADTKALRVAIVTDVNTKKDLICVVEGDSHDAVEETWYSADDPEIVGYGTMPVELRDEVEAYKKLVAERKKAEKEAAKKAVEEEAARKAEEEAAKKAAEEAAAKKAAEEEAARKAEEEARKAAEEAAAQLEAEAKEVPQVLFAEVDGYGIKANLGGEAQEGYTLWVKPLKATKKRLAAVEEGLTQELPDGATKQAHVDADDVVLFDISVRDKDDNEVELSKKVRITVTQLEDGSEATASGETSALQTPDVVHLADEGTEVLNAKPKDDGFTFTTKSLSPFAFVFTVDFEYQGYEWSMPGKGSALLSQVLEQLHVGGFTIADVTDATFSNPKLVEVTQQDNDGKRDWLLTSKKPFTSNETLTLTLASGDTATINVTDEGDDHTDPFDHENPYNLWRLLDRVQFYDGENLVGDSTSPESMVVRPGHEYTMRLEFSEDEDADDPVMGQMPDDGVMYYEIPKGVYLSPKAFDVDKKVTFEIVLDRKHTLYDNVVEWVPNDDNDPNSKSYLKITWNKNDAANYKLLKASPRTTFMLSFPYTTVKVDEKQDIKFSDDAILSVDPDLSYDVELEKTSEVDPSNKEIIKYDVTAIADGDVQSVKFTDVMGAALTYIYEEDNAESGIEITYKHITSYKQDGSPVYEAYASNELPPDYGASNMGVVNVAEGDHGFDFVLTKLHSSDMAVITYKAHVDYAKLGGKSNIDTTSRNTVTATDDKNNILATATQVLDKNIDYLQIGKAKASNQIIYMGKDTEDGPEYDVTSSAERGTKWTSMYVPWKVIYNPDHQINVEGATLKDTVWMGKKYSTSYITGDPTKPFKVTAYPSGKFTKDDGATGDTFVPDSAGIPIITPNESNGYGWDDVKSDVLVTEPNKDRGQLSSWEWTIPEKGATEGLTGGPYVYVVEYWTKIDRYGPDSGGYVGNQVTESIAGITRDKSVELPGVGPGYEIEVNKRHVIDDYDDKGRVFTNWEISFERRASERAVVEDTLPHILLKDTDGKGSHVCSDRFVDDIAKYRMTITGLHDNEQCVPSISADGYDVKFWFFTSKDAMGPDDPNINTPHQGLDAATGTTDEDKTITISFWTENDQEWIQAAADGRYADGATNEHWNHVHLVLNGKENVAKAYAVPKPKSEIKKSVKTVGSWTDGQTTLPVYRYTLSLNGMSDDSFTKVGDNYVLTVTDEYDKILEYLPKSELAGWTEGNHEISIQSQDQVRNGKEVTLDSTSVSDEVLVRPVPKADPDVTWPAVITGPTSESGATKKIAITITITPEQWAKMKYQVLDEDGNPLEIPVDPDEPNGEKKIAEAYGRSYEVSYYLAPEFTEVKAKAQDMVDHNRTSEADTQLVFSNKATWENIDGPATANECTATTNYNMKPVQKQLVNYDPTSELATYSIDVNPLRLRMNNGQRYSVQDAYANLAVDFQTVHFEVFPEDRRDQIEWSYHNNKGVFWVPDETRVRITYEGWPIGKHGATGFTISNTASVGDYSDPTSASINLKVDHEGYASTYHVRIFKFEDDNMDKPLAGAVFQLFERDEHGNIVEMKYKADHSTINPAEDDYMWSIVNAGRPEGDRYPTPENHHKDDFIYFITGCGDKYESTDVDNSAQAGFADVMLSQARDGVALKKNKQYYLREVQEPSGHTMEDIYWRFIIGDNDDWDSYVYSDDSILQVSNASVERVLTVHKNFIDRTAAKKITSAVQKGLKFEIVGVDMSDETKIVYNKTVSYDDFKWVGSGTNSEKLLIVHSLPAGKYTVREIRSSAMPAETELVTSAKGTATVTTLDNEGNPDPGTPDEVTPVGTDVNENGDTYFTFTVPQEDIFNTETNETEHTKTSVDAEFTNIYTDPDSVSLTIGKQWDNGGKDAFQPVKSEYSLYADGKKYDLSKADGNFVNDNGNIEIAAGTDSSWSGEAEINNLPKKKTIETVDPETGKVTTTSSDDDIVWTVKEVSTTYNTTGQSANTVSVEDIYLKEHFTTTVNGTAVSEAESGDSFDEDNEALFTNTFNNLTTVNVRKVWADADSNEHTGDVAYFDLYRTTETISSSTSEALRALANDSTKSELVDSKIRLSASDTPAFTYQNSLLEKVNNTGNAYHYFALERSVAGYSDTYVITETAGTEGNNDGRQQITITNTALNNDPLGKLTIQKSVTPSVLAEKTFKFTLWNSGKYVQNENGELGTEPHEFSVASGSQTPVTISNLKEGTYTLTEVKGETQIGGYNLTSTSAAVTVGSEAPSSVNFNDDLEADIFVKGTPTPISSGGDGDSESVEQKTTSVVVTNTYEKDNTQDSKTDFTFGKLWTMPAEDNDKANTGDTTTLTWPNYIRTTMQLGRRKKGTNDEDGSFVPVYTFERTTGNTIAVTASDETLSYQLNNPDVSQSSTTSAAAISYHHYTLTVKDLDKYAPDGSEWEYFAKETSVEDISGTTPVNLQDPTNSTGRYFTEHYGVVDGIGARALADEAGDTSVAEGGNVGYAINRLAITQKVKVPIKKFINGWPNWGEKDTSIPAQYTSDYMYPPFVFRLYDSAGHPIVVDDNGNPVNPSEGGESSGTDDGTNQGNGDDVDPSDNNQGSNTSSGHQLSEITNNKGYAEFEIPDSLIDTENLMWWSDEEVLYGTQSFWIKEDSNPSSETLPSATSPYNGIKNYAGSARVMLTMRYNWKTGQFQSTARVSGNEYTDENGIERGVINNNYDPDETTLVVTKTWEDEGNQDGYRRPAKFKVHAKYKTGTEGTGDDEHDVYQDLNKVWFIKNVKTPKTTDSGTLKYVDEKAQDIIVLNDDSEPYDPSKEFRITVEPPDTGKTSTAKATLPKYYEGHLIIYTAEEMLEESQIESGVTLKNKYRSTVAYSNQTGKWEATNTHTPEKVNLGVEKLWTGDDPQQETRTVSVRLKASYGGTQITSENATTVDYWKDHTDWFAPKAMAKGEGNDGKWLASWEGLPRYAPGSEGKEVIYTLEEVASSMPMGYHELSNVKGTLEPVTGSDGTFSLPITITNEYKTVSIPAKKIWDDDNNRDKIRDANTTVTYTLSATVGNSQIDIINELLPTGMENTVTITNSDAQSVNGTTDTNTWVKEDAWQNLPMYYQGQKIIYKVTETMPAGWGDKTLNYENDGPKTSEHAQVGQDGTINTGTITNTHELFATQITLTKTWDDGNNRDGKRPSPVEFVNSHLELQGNILTAENYATLTLGEEKTREENQPVNQYKYTLKNGNDVVKDAEVIITGDNGSYTDTTPEGIVAYNTYTVVFKVPRYRSKLIEVTYKLAEKDIDGYQRVSVEDDTVISSDSPIDIVYGDGTIGETDTKEGTAAAKNKYVPEHIDLTVTKQWKHGANDNNPDKPTTAKVKLVATSAHKRIDTDEEWATLGYSGITTEVSLTGSNASHTWNRLPTNVPGMVNENITYTIEEVNVPAGYHMVSEPAGVLAMEHAKGKTAAMTITNYYEEAKVTATKVWDDKNDQDGLRKSVKFQLQQQFPGYEFTDYEDPVVISATGSQPVSWENLLAWQNNQPVNYRVVEIPNEESLVDYETTGGGLAYPQRVTISGDNDEIRTYEINGTITNTHAPKTYTAEEPLTFTKVWDHKGVPFNLDENGLSPNDMLSKLHLWARVKNDPSTLHEVKQGESYWTPELVTNNDWRSSASISEGYVVTVIGLPHYKPKNSELDPAQELEYFITEDDRDISDYSVAYNPESAPGSDATKMVGADGTLNNVRDTAPLKISKTVDSHLVADHNTQFEFRINTEPKINNAGVPATEPFVYKVYDSLHPEGVVHSLSFVDGISTTTIELTSGQYAIIEGLPVGVTYTVTESPNSNFITASTPVTSYQPEGSEEVVVDNYVSSQTLAAKGVQKDVSFTNTRKLGQLSVQKSVVSPLKSETDATEGRDFWFHVELDGLTTTEATKTFGDGNGHNVTFNQVDNTNKYVGTFALKNGGEQVFTNLPIGVTYTVTETDAENDNAAPSNFTTTWKRIISKTTTTGETAVTTVKDTKNGSGAKFPGSDATASHVISDDDSRVVFTNTRNLGELTINKNLANAIPDDDNDKFYFDVQLLDSKLLDSSGQPLELDASSIGLIKVNGKSISATTSTTKPYYDANAQIIKNVPVTTSTITNVTGATGVTKQASGSTTVAGLPQGVKCIVTESPTSSINIENDSSATQTIDSLASANATTFNNTRKTGSLKINKLVESPVNVENTAEYDVHITLKSKKNKAVSGITANLTWDPSEFVGRPSTRETSITFDEHGAATIGICKGETVTISGIPTDVNYTITEPSYDEFTKTFKIDSSGTSTDTGKQSATADVVVNASGNSVPYTTEITNTRKLGNLTVGKTVASSVASDKTKDYTFTVALTPPEGTQGTPQISNESPFTHGEGISFDTNNTTTFTLRHGLAKEITNLPVGWTYTVAESAASGSNITSGHFATTWTRTVSSNPADSKNGDGLVVPAASGTAGSDVSHSIEDDSSTVVFTNTRNTGELKIDKTLEHSIPDDEGDKFYFNVELKYNGETLSSDSLAPIKVNNTSVPFSTTEPAATTENPHPTYYNTATGTLMNVPVTLSTQEHGLTTITGVPLDTTYTVDEETDTGYLPQNISLDTHHIKNDSGTVTSTQTAEFTNTRAVYRMRIVKQVEENGPVPADKEADYSFTLSLKTKTGKTVKNINAVWAKDSDTDLEHGNSLVFGDDGKQTIVVKGGHSVYIGNIPTEVICTVEEIDANDRFNETYTSTNYDSDPQSIEIVDNHLHTVTITNSRRTGNLTVNKSVVSTVAGDKSHTYTFEVEALKLDGADVALRNGTYGDMTFNNSNKATFTLNVSSSSSITATGLPTGLTYKVAEVGSGAEATFLDNFTTSWTRTIGTGSSPDPISPDDRVFTGFGNDPNTIGLDASTVTATNTRKTDTFTLNKSLVNAIPTDEGDTFYFNVRLRGDDVQSGQTEGQPLVLDANAPITVKSGNNSWTLNTTSNDHPYYDATEGIIRNVPVVWHAATQTSSAGGTTTIEGLPWGATYTVTEVSVNTPITGNPGNITNATSKTNDTGTITDTTLSQNADANTASFQNTRKTGSLSINKHVVSPVTQEKASTYAYSVEVQLNTTHKVGGENKSVSEFTPTFTRTNGDTTTDYENPPAFDQDGKATITLHQDETVTISGIPTDVTYTVTEPNTNPEYFNKTYGIYNSDTHKYVDTTHQYASGGIPTNDTAKTQVINTRKLGDLVVSKAVNSAVASDKTHNYHFKVELTSPVSGQTLDAGKYTGDNGMEFRSGNDANTAEFDLCDQGRKTATGLPVGWTYTVTESASTGSGAADLSKFNTTWTKTVTANGSGTTTDEDNGSGYACPVSSASGGSGQTQTTYSIEEDTTSAIEFLNTRKTGQLQLTKTVRSPFGKEKDATYQFKVSLQIPANGGTPEPITYAFDATNCTGNTVQFSQGVATINVQGRQDRPVVISGLPIDAEYAVTEVVNDTNTFEVGAAQYNKIVSTSTTPVADNRASHVIEENVTYGAAVTNTRTKVPVSILKVSATYVGTKLEGAVFTLTAPDDNDLRTRLGWTTKELVSDAQGYLCEDGGTKRFELLPSDGLYTLEEVKAPLGYHKLAQAATFKVTPDGVVYTDSIHPQNCVETNDSDTPANRVVHVNVANSTGTELPSTGGLGTTAIYAAGCTLIALAGFSALRRRKA